VGHRLFAALDGSALIRSRCDTTANADIVHEYSLPDHRPAPASTWTAPHRPSLAVGWLIPRAFPQGHHSGRRGILSWVLALTRTRRTW
jgi:hypothetical protein